MNRLPRVFPVPLLLILSPPTGADVNQGLVAYWSFDEGHGDVVRDAVHSRPDLYGVSSEGKLIRGIWSSGKFGSGLDFSAGDALLRVVKRPELDCPQQVTVAAWVKLGEATGRGMVVNHEFAYRLAVNPNGRRRVFFQLNLNGRWAQNWLVGRSSLLKNRWQHIAGVFDGRQRRLYIDGRLDAEEAVSGALSAGRDFLIGGSARKRGHSSETVFEHFPGVIDEVKVWRRALSEEELRSAAAQSLSQVQADLPPAHDLFVYPVHCVGRVGERSPYELAIFNSADHKVRAVGRLTIVDSTHRALHHQPIDAELAPGELRRLQVRFTPAAAGGYRLTADLSGESVFATELYALAPHAREPVGELRKRRLYRVDLSQPLDADRLCDDGASHIVRTKAGVYREAGSTKFSRFVVHLPLARTGLHLLRVTYPDDRTRTCEIASWSPNADDRFNIHSGYFTGDDYPLSGEMRTLEFLLWARDVEQALVFTTWLEGQPAAAASIDVFEIEGRLPASSASRVPSRRWLGLYWEDAQPLSRCFGGGLPTLEDFDQVARNLCDYLDYSGQNLLMHPIVWYEGPIYNSLVETRGGKGGFHMPTNGWVDILLRRFEECGFRFYGLFNVHQLPSLVRDMNADAARVQAGEPTYNAVSATNEVADHTWHHRHAMFNALHPKVQERVLALVQEAADRWGGSPAFGGVGFHLTLAQLLQPGSMEVSYDDWTVGEFERDTGQTIPVDGRDPQRFSRRADWIHARARQQWIDWRCRRVADFYRRAAAILRKRRSDLQLVVTLLEPPMSIIDPQREAWRGGKTLVEMSREGGIDPTLLSAIPNLVLQQRLGPTAKRKRMTFGLQRGRFGAPPPTAESLAAIRAMDFAADQQRAYRLKPQFGVFLYNRYFESAVGRTKPLTCSWYRSIPWRATAVVPGGEHFMEYYAHAVEMLDPSLLAIGGFTTGTVGHESQVARLAAVFRQLPIGDWQELQSLPAGVSGAKLVTRAGAFLRLVNSTAHAVSVNLPGTTRRAPVGGSPVADGGKVQLDAYQLAAWSISP